MSKTPSVHKPSTGSVLGGASQLTSGAEALAGAAGSDAQVSAMEAAATHAAQQQMEMSLLQAQLEVGKTAASLVSTAAQKG